MEKFHIRNLVEKSSGYKEGRVLETLQSDNMTIFLVDGREKRPIKDIGSISESTRETCPYCHEAIPCAHLGDIADWNITENKYPGTDIEVIAMSKEHSPHLKNTDFRAWMYMSEVTDATLLYSPARKSFPEHKHVQLLDLKASALFKEHVRWIDDVAGYTDESRNRSIVIRGDFETRLGKTISVLRKLYIRENLYNIIITPDKTYILPSKIPGRMLDARIFVGIMSTTDKKLFEGIKTKLNQDGGPVDVVDYSDCNYEEKELIELLKEGAGNTPLVEDVGSGLNELGASIGAVLALGDDNIVSGLSLANGLGAEFQSSGFAFITDKKSNFFPDCFPPAFDAAEGEDMLVVLERLTDNIRSYLVKLKEYYKSSGIYVIFNAGDGKYVLEKAVGDMPVESQVKIKACPIEARDSGFLVKQIEDLKRTCESESSFIDMVIGLDTVNVGNVNRLQREFPSSTMKIMRTDNKSGNWKSIDNYIRNNIQPVLRDFNPATSRLLGHVAESYREIIASQPKHKREEGVLVVYADIGSESKQETYREIINMLAVSTGRKVRIIYGNEAEMMNLNVEQIDHPIEFPSLKPGSEVIVLEKNIIKKMVDNELEAYMLLRRYSDRLHNDSVSVVVPELLDYDRNLQQGLISRIGNFPIYSPCEYFGLAKVYGGDYYKSLHEVSEIIRRNIPCHEIPNQLDVEAFFDGTNQTLVTIENDLKGTEDRGIDNLSENVKEMVLRTQERIIELPLYPSHRDPNPNNYKMVCESGHIYANVIDWETLGLARRGYEEGRFMVCLALDKLKQDDYARFIMDKLNVQERIYFWRTVATRALHEMSSVSRGLYDARLIPSVRNVDDVQKLKIQLNGAFRELAERALDQINSIIENE